MTRICVLSVLAGFLTPISLASPETPPADGTNSVRIGMNQRELKQALGQPAHISRLILFRRHFEQWHYVEPAHWVEFDAPHGDQATVDRFSGDGK